MSTRANIVIENGESRVILYRHCDGYLAESGRDIYAKLGDASPSAFMRAMLIEQYEATSYGRPASPVYEITDGIHGDIEYLYLVRFRSGKPVLAGFQQFRPGDERPDNANGVALHGLDAFKVSINGAIFDMNQRLERLKAEQPAAYGDCEPVAVLA